MRKFATILLLITTTAGAQFNTELPKGLVLNLDFEGVSEGLVPSKTLYPMFVPLNNLGIEYFNSRNMLAFQFGQGLDIPHSSLLDPNGDEWVITLRVFPLTDGIIVSQSNDKYGYVIHMKDGHIAARIRTGQSAFTLMEHSNRGLTKYKNRWVTIELRIKNDMAILSLNRKRVSMIRMEPALQGENLLIRLGNHSTVPSPLNHTDIPATGFTGAINSFKIMRQ